MTTPLSTLLLDTSAWDLVLDANGDIALASPPYSVAQDVASAIRTFQGEVWYDTSLGVPYWQQLLSQSTSTQQIASALDQAALTVPSVTTANTAITSISGRKLNGQIQFITSDGEETTVNFQ